MKSKNVTFLVPELPRALDPLIVRTPTQYIYLDHLAGTLVTTSKSNEIIGELAKSWSVSDEFTKFTFQLDDNSWSDGEKLTAYDVVQHFKRTLKHGRTTHADFSNLDDVKATSPHSITLILKNPDADFLLKLAAPEAGIYKDSDSSYGPVSKKFSVTSGPYFLLKDENDGTTFTKNRFFKHSMVNSPDTVRFVEVSKDKLVKATQTKQDFFSWVPRNTSVKELELFSTDKAVRVFQPHIYFAHFVSLNPQSNALKNLKTRQKIQKTIWDNKEMFASHEANFEKTDQLFLPDSPARLKDEYINNFFKKMNTSSELIPSPLTLVGIASRQFIDETTQILEKSKIFLVSKIAKNSEDFVELVKDVKNYDVAVMRVDISSADLIENLNVIFNSKTPYISLSSKSKIHELMTSIRSTSDALLKYKYYKEISQTLLQESLVIPIAHESLKFFHSASLDVSGLSTTYPDIRFWRTSLR